MPEAAPQPCRQCDYDLTGLPTRGSCPECGNYYNKVSGQGLAVGPAADHRRADRIMARVRTILLLVAIVVVMSCGGVLAWVVNLYQGNWLRPLAMAGIVCLILAMAAALSFLNQREL